MAIAQWQYFFNPNFQDIEKGNYLVFEVDSQAEIIDWLKREDVAKKEKDEFIYSLINFEDNCGGFYEYQAYLLVAKYIKQFPSSIYAEEIVEQLEEWSRGYFGCNKHKIDFSRIITKNAEKALKTTDNKKAIAVYEKALQSSKEQKFKTSTAEKLLELDSNNKIAIATIKNLLINNSDKETVFKLIRLCDEYEIVTETVIDILIKFINKINSGDSPEFMPWVSNTFYYLEKLAKGNREAIDGLIHLLERIPSHYPREDIEICELALRVLGAIGTNNSAAINTLKNLLHSDRPDSVICMAAIAL